MRELEEIIKDEIRISGPVPFERFMELALYHPEFGYYSSGRAKIGKEGDFYTSSHASPVFGRMLAETFLKMKASVPGNAAFIEAGAGEGWFAKDFIEHMERLHPGEFAGLRYFIVERSKGLKERQKETLGGLQEKVSWLESVKEVPSGTAGVIFSNELMDAFPVHRVHQEQDALKEIYVTLDRGRFHEVTGALSTPGIARYLNGAGARLAAGMTTEVNLAAVDWMADAASRLEKGFIITVDYGYTAGEYYSPGRDRGTLLCYYRHTVSEDPYAHVGEQDITSHAEFSSLAQAGRLQGAEPVLFTDQTSFLLESIGWLEESMRAAGDGPEELLEAARGMKSIVHPDWMGGVFKALVQSKGITGLDLYRRSRNHVRLLVPVPGYRALDAL